MVFVAEVDAEGEIVVVGTDPSYRIPFIVATSFLRFNLAVAVGDGDGVGIAARRIRREALLPAPLPPPNPLNKTSAFSVIHETSL